MWYEIPHTHLFTWGGNMTNNSKLLCAGSCSFFLSSFKQKIDTSFTCTRTHTHSHIDVKIICTLYYEKILSGDTRSRNLLYDSYKSVVKPLLIYVSIGLICFNIFAHFFDNSYCYSHTHIYRFSWTWGAENRIHYHLSMHTCTQL